MDDTTEHGDRPFATASGRADGIEATLQVRVLIGQAQGVLMARLDIDSEAALALLQRRSQELGATLGEIATGVVRTGRLTASPLMTRADEVAATRVLMRASDHPVIKSFPHGAIFVFDDDLRYLSVGGRGLAEVGLSRATVEGRTLHEVFPSTVVEQVEQYYRAALVGESTSSDVVHAGKVFTLELAPVLDDDGTIVAGMGFIRDVTEARESERQLRESEQRVRLAFEHAPIGKAIVGLDGTFREVNPALCRLTGYRSDVLRSMTFQEITHPDDLNADVTQLGQLVSGEIDNYAMEKRYVTADGEVVWVMLTVSMVVSDDGRPMYFISQMQDITDRKRSDMSLRESHAREAAELEYAATHDALTGLPNRRIVDQQLASLLNPAGRQRVTHGVAVLFCDLDGFKAVNDEHGHDVGDGVLCEAASRLVTAARPGDTVGRVGGDEFVVLMETRTGEDERAASTVVAEQICAAFAVGFGIRRLALSITVSVGIAVSEGAVDSVDLLRKADAAMYEAKKAGKNRYVHALQTGVTRG